MAKIFYIYDNQVFSMKKVIFAAVLIRILTSCGGSGSVAEQVRKMDSTMAAEEGLVMSKAELVDELVKSGMTEEDAKTQAEILISNDVKPEDKQIVHQLMKEGMTKEEAQKRATEMKTDHAKIDSLK